VHVFRVQNGDMMEVQQIFISTCSVTTILARTYVSKPDLSSEAMPFH
jgi:hypothetical protein